MILYSVESYAPACRLTPMSNEFGKDLRSSIRAMIAQSVIGAEAQIGANARLDHAVVADRGVVAEGAHLATGERVEAAP